MNNPIEEALLEASPNMEALFPEQDDFLKALKFILIDDEYDSYLIGTFLDYLDSLPIEQVRRIRSRDAKEVDLHVGRALAADDASGFTAHMNILFNRLNSWVDTDSRILDYIKQAYEGGMSIFRVLNSDSRASENSFGFWREHPLSELRGRYFPVVVECEGYDKDLFIEKLERIQHTTTVTSIDPEHNKFTGAIGAGHKYKLDGWEWPGHAVDYLSINVPPTKAFYEFIMEHPAPDSLPY